MPGSGHERKGVDEIYQEHLNQRCIAVEAESSICNPSTQRPQINGSSLISPSTFDPQRSGRRMHIPARPCGRRISPVGNKLWESHPHCKER
jgi:hypothetical protein